MEASNQADSRSHGRSAALPPLRGGLGWGWWGHCLKIAFRNLRKHKTQSFTGIFGLAFGIACFIPALYWMRYETSYDGFYPDAGNIYRIYAVEKQSGKVNERVPGILEKKLHEHFPATENSAGFVLSYENYSTEGTPHIRLRTLYTDSAFFRVFPQVFAGGARQPLQTVRDIILTESTAIRLFGDAEKAVGQQVKSTLYGFPPYTVTAVVKDPPPNTNLSFDAIHFPEIQAQMTDYMPEEAQWTYFNKQLYVKFHARADAENLAGRLRDFTSQRGVNNKTELHLLPIGDVRHRLNADLPFTLPFIRLFVASGLLLLFSAFFNFLNLYLGLFRRRIREFRLRAVNGATGAQLMMQMMTELAFTVLVALLLAACLIALICPAFSGLLGIVAETSRLMNQFAVCGILTMALILLTGMAPLRQLCRPVSHDPARGRPAGRTALRRAAMVLQLAVSMMFIVATLTVMLQLRYVSRKDLGFDRHGVIQLSGMEWTGDENRTAIKDQLSAMPQITGFTETSFAPQHEDHAMITEVEWPGKPPHDQPAFQSIGVDGRFAETLKLNLRQGRWWNEGDRQKVILNGEAVRVMGLSDPVGTVIRMFPEYVSGNGNNPMLDYEVVGVTDDFHTLSLRSRIHPVIFRNSEWDAHIYIRVTPGLESETIQRLTDALPKIDARLADARLTLLDELYGRLNRSEMAGLKMFTVLSAVCLLISLSGIYAVATASTRRRRREIAIRKVSGAESGDMVRMFFREYTLHVVIAGVVALPPAFLAMNRWLQGYAYHTDIPWWLPAGVMVAVTLLVLLTVWRQVLKAANSNPAEVVKYE
ncbi:MAG: ABC transporter permease [Bacteroidales bacterium]|jgi:putative ABC transport system permease protein|nr:ABC transporter permease [Bacteroidales bacterium]